VSKREQSRQKRHGRIRLKMFGTAEKPRLVVHRSLKNFEAHVVDDAEGKVIFSMATTDKSLKQKFVTGGNVKSAQAFGEIFAQKAKEKGVAEVIFDRAGYLYHGRVKVFAEALRKGGLKL